MQETEPTRSRWLRLTLTLSAKLNILLLGAMVVIFALLGYLNVRLHRQHLEQNTLLSAERVSDVIKHSTTDYMLRNDQRRPVSRPSRPWRPSPAWRRSGFLIRKAESPIPPIPPSRITWSIRPPKPVMRAMLSPNRWRG